MTCRRRQSRRACTTSISRTRAISLQGLQRLMKRRSMPASSRWPAASSTPALSQCGARPANHRLAVGRHRRGRHLARQPRAARALGGERRPLLCRATDPRLRRWTMARAAGLGMLMRKSMPGIGKRWLSLCETPDLDLLHARFAPRRSAVFRAGLELSILHLGLSAASFLVRLGLMRSLATARADVSTSRRSPDPFRQRSRRHDRRGAR